MKTYEERIAQNEIYERVIAAEEDVENGGKAVPAREVFAGLRKKYVK